VKDGRLTTSTLGSWLSLCETSKGDHHLRDGASKCSCGPPSPSQALTPVPQIRLLSLKLWLYFPKCTPVPRLLRWNPCHGPSCILTKARHMRPDELSAPTPDSSRSILSVLHTAGHSVLCLPCRSLRSYHKRHSNCFC
jgi:hypothetical protein